MLPNEYGGEAGTIAEINGALKLKVTSSNFVFDLFSRSGLCTRADGFQ
jgi:hypothetical protein